MKDSLDILAKQKSGMENEEIKIQTIAGWIQETQHLN